MTAVNGLLKQAERPTSEAAGLSVPADRAQDGEVYGASYYATHCGQLPYARRFPHWTAFFGSIADRIRADLMPRRVFDAGCAHGFLVEALWDRGIEAWGRDISSYAVSQVRADMRAFISQGSITDPIDDTFDLITCIEVLEHLPEAEAITAIGQMTAAAPRILFSSSPNDFGEPTHINVKPVRWWLDRFAEAGFVPESEFDASFLTPHAFLLTRRDAGRAPGDLRLFAELVRQRMLSHERGIGLQGKEAILQALEGRNAELRTELETRRAEAAGLQKAISRERGSRADAERRARQAHRISAVVDRFIQEIKAAIQPLEAAGRLRQVPLEQQPALIHAVLTEVPQHVSRMARALQVAEQDRLVLKHRLDALLYSTSWRVTRPLRLLGGVLPARLKRSLIRLARLLYRTVTLTLHRRTGENRSVRLPAGPSPVAAPAGAALQEPYDAWIDIHERLTEMDIILIRQHIAALAHPPLISIVMPVYESDEVKLRSAIASVRAQFYPHWELCIADDRSPSPHVRWILAEIAAEEPRLRWIGREENGNISAASNSALALANGDFVALMDHDDLLAQTALYEIAVAIDQDPELDILYSDEDHIDDEGRRSNPYFKPSWNEELLLGQNLISHLGVYRRSLIAEIGGFRVGFEGSQDYDLALRAVAATRSARIRHIPKVLYHWRQSRTEASFSQTQQQLCVANARRAVADYLAGKGVTGAVVQPAELVPSWNHVVLPLPDPVPLVSVIVPTRDGATLLRQCLAGVLHRTDYPHIEVIIADNGSETAETRDYLAHVVQDARVRVLPLPMPFNFSALNNAAVRESSGSVLLFLNNDIDVIGPRWLREMVSLAVRPDTGCVGAKLLYADDTIQHAGVLLGAGTFDGAGGVAGHYGTGVARHEIGYFGRYALTTEVAAVTAACMAVRRTVFDAVGGFDNDNLAVAFNDVDLCLRIREKGWRNIWTPAAELYHLESASRGSDLAPEKVERFNRECRFMRTRWGSLLDHDPFYHQAFDRRDDGRRLSLMPQPQSWEQAIVLSPIE